MMDEFIDSYKNSSQAHFIHVLRQQSSRSQILLLLLVVVVLLVLLVFILPNSSFSTDYRLPQVYAGNDNSVLRPSCSSH